MPTVSGIVTLCKLPYRALIESGHRCSKYVEEYNVTYVIEE